MFDVFELQVSTAPLDVTAAKASIPATTSTIPVRSWGASAVASESPHTTAVPSSFNANHAKEGITVDTIFLILPDPINSAIEVVVPLLYTESWPQLTREPFDFTATKAPELIEEMGKISSTPEAIWETTAVELPPDIS